MGTRSAAASFVFLLPLAVSSSSTIFAFTTGPSTSVDCHGRVVVSARPHSEGWWCRNRRTTSTSSAVGEGVDVGDRDHRTEDVVSSSPLAVRGDRGDEDEDGTEKRRDVSSLRRWAAEEGVRVADGVEVMAGAEGGGDDDWGVSIVRPAELTAGDVVLSVPRSLVLSSRTILERHGDDRFEPAWDMLESAGLRRYRPELVLVIEILTELSRGTSSRWHAWLHSLPTTFDTGVHMDGVERSLLPPVALALTRLEDRKLEAFRAAIDTLVAQADGRDRFPDLSRMVKISSGDEGGGHSDVVDGHDDAVRWAYDVVFTRCWRRHGETGPGADACIVPLGDMFNHREPSNVFVRDDDDDSDSGESSDTVDIVLKHDLPVDVDAGRGGGGDDAETTGLYLSYGLPDPHRYLVMFGFVDDTMPEVYSQLMFPNPKEELRSLGCDDVSAMVFRTEDGRIANAVWDCALYAIISASESESESESKREGELSALLDAHQRGDAEAKVALHDLYSLEVCAYLYRHVEATLADLRTDLDGVCGGEDDDEVTMAKDHPRLRLVIRHNEFVGGVFRKVKHRLECMISTELKTREQEA